nr:beta-lactamase family protein [Bacteroidota bacterium]
MKKKVSIIFLCAALLSGISSSAQSNQIGEKEIADINKMVEDLSGKDKFSGTVLIAKDGKIVFQNAQGFADKQLKSKNNIDTKFNLASMNKMFTSIAISQLVEKNLLSYTDKVVKYLPNLPEKTFGKITIEQLLTHTSGAGDIFRNPKFMEMKDTAKTIASYVDLGIDEPLMFEPGEKFEYSNYGYILLGAVIEKISYMSYFNYVKENIFSVAGMNNTDSYETDNANENMAIGYATPPTMPNQEPPAEGEKIERVPNTKFIEVKGTSAGGGYSTAIDLHKFSQALLSGKLLSLKSVEAITKGRVVMPSPPNAKISTVRKYGLGFGEVYKNNMRIIGHNGGAPGVEGQVDIYPDLGYTVIVLSNYDRAAIPIINFIEDIITKKL